MNNRGYLSRPLKILTCFELGQKNKQNRAITPNEQVSWLNAYWNGDLSIGTPTLSFEGKEIYCLKNIKR